MLHTIQLPDEIQLCISSVTRYELMIGARNEEKKKDVAILTDGLEILPFTAQIADNAAEIYHDLRRKNKMIEFRDIFIGPTAIVNGMPLLSANLRDFERISGLSFFEI